MQLTNGEVYYAEIEFVVSGLHSYYEYRPPRLNLIYVNGFYGYKVIPRLDVDKLEKKPFWTKKPMFEIKNFSRKIK